MLAVDMAEGPEAGSSDAQVKLVKVQTWDVAGESISLFGWLQRSSSEWDRIDGAGRGGTSREGRSGCVRARRPSPPPLSPSLLNNPTTPPAILTPSRSRLVRKLIGRVKGAGAMRKVERREERGAL